MSNRERFVQWNCLKFIEKKKTLFWGSSLIYLFKKISDFDIIFIKFDPLLTAPEDKLCFQPC